MQIIKKEIKQSSIYQQNETAIIMDIETTGLGYHQKIILIGIVIIKHQSDTVEFVQFFNDDGHSEKAILESFISLSDEVNLDYWITFNGTAFDFSFINARLKHHNMGHHFSKIPNVDLLKVARQHKMDYPLDKLALKELERFYGIKREDTISGKESVDLYFQFLNTKDQMLKEKILMHNEDDILNIIPLYHHMKAHLNFRLPIVLQLNKRKLYVAQFNQEKYQIGFQASHLFTQNNPTVFIDRLNFHVSTTETHLSIEIPVITLSSTLTVVDTDKLYLRPFASYNNEEKQKFIFIYNNIYYEDNISNILSDIIKTNKKDIT